MDRIIVRFLSGGRQGHAEVYPVARFESLYLGRDPGCDVRVHAEQDAMVSRSHAVVEWIDDELHGRRYLLTDLLSSNGTYLNGLRVKGTVTLASGDHVRLGANGPEFVFELERAELEAHPVITQSVRIDPRCRTPPPIVGTTARDANATRRGPPLKAALATTQEPDRSPADAPSPLRPAR